MYVEYIRYIKTIQKKGKKYMMTFKEAMYKVLSKQYKSDLELQRRYKTFDDFIEAIQNAKTPQAFKEIYKDTETEERYLLYGKKNIF